MKTRSNALGAVLTLALASAFAPVAMAQESLPFPPIRRAARRRGRCRNRPITRCRYRSVCLPDAPNIVIMLIDDAGPALPTTYGGEIHTPTLTASQNRYLIQPLPYDGDVLADARLVADGTKPSPHRQRPDRRAGQRLGRLLGQHPQEQRRWSPRCCGNYGYATAACGKWHNTPAQETPPRGRSTMADRRLGFEYFYGFLAGEASQYEPNWCATQPHSATKTPAGLPPDRGPRGQRDRLAAPAPGARAGQAVLHVLGPGAVMARTTS